MKLHPFFWLLQRNRKRLPAISVMVLARMGHALCMVLFALGSQGVIDAAVAGNMDGFLAAAVKQGAIITGIVGCLTIVRHLQSRLVSDLERDWKRRLLHGLLHGDYAEISKFPVFDLFDGAVVSYAERVNKPDRKIYEIILSRYGLEPSETIFADDKAANTAAASEFGIHTVTYDCCGSGPDDVREVVARLLN